MTMDKQFHFAEIPQLNGVAFSDPWYGPEIHCQYRNDFRPSSGWAMKMESFLNPDGILEFALFLGRPSTLSGLGVTDKGDRSVIHHYAHHQLEEKEIGIDTACVVVASYDNFQKFGESASVYTGADGLFGDLNVITCKGEDEPAGFLLIGGVDPDLTPADELFRTFAAGFGGHAIDRERYETLTSRDNLEVRKQLAKEFRHFKAYEQAEKSHERGKGDIER